MKTWGEMAFGQETHLNQLWRIAMDYLEHQINFHKTDPYGDPHYNFQNLEDIKMLLEDLNTALLECQKSAGKKEVAESVEGE